MSDNTSAHVRGCRHRRGSGRSGDRTLSVSPGPSVRDPRSRGFRCSRLAHPLGLARSVHAAPLRQPARAGVPWRPRRLPDARRGHRLPRRLRRAQFALPVQLDSAVRSLTKKGDTFQLELDDRTSRPTRSSSPPGRSRRPRLPAVRRATSHPEVFQIHSANYRASDIPEGRCWSSAVVTPASRSRASFREPRVHLAVGGRQTPLPQRLLGRDLFWWLVTTRAARARLSTRGSARS